MRKGKRLGTILITILAITVLAAAADARFGFSPPLGVLGFTNAENWETRLVNPWNPLPEGFTPPSLGVTRDGYYFDSRAVNAVDELIAGGAEAGYALALVSAYRTQEYQSQLFENKVSQYLAEGYSREDSERHAATVVARPGHSEHNLGLAVDITSASHTALDGAFGNTAEALWLRENCAEYGFILRYPEDKTDITGIIYEPWHFRYVGKSTAQYIMSNDLTLEEYLGMVQNNP